MDAAPYLNQARAIYLGGMSELDAALELLSLLDEDLEVGEFTIFVDALPPPPDQPGVRRHQTKACRTRSCARCSPESPPGGPPSRRPPRRLAVGPTRVCPPPVQDQGRPPQGAGPLVRAPGHPRASPRPHDPLRPRAGPWGQPHPSQWGIARAPTPPPGTRGAGRGARFSADPGGHRRYGGPPYAAPPSNNR